MSCLCGTAFQAVREQAGVAQAWALRRGSPAPRAGARGAWEVPPHRVGHGRHCVQALGAEVPGGLMDGRHGARRSDSARGGRARAAAPWPPTLATAPPPRPRWPRLWRRASCAGLAGPGRRARRANPSRAARCTAPTSGGEPPGPSPVGPWVRAWASRGAARYRPRTGAESGPGSGGVPGGGAVVLLRQGRPGQQRHGHWSSA